MVLFETLWQQTWRWMHLIINVYNTPECQSRGVKKEAVRGEVVFLSSLWKCNIKVVQENQNVCSCSGFWEMLH